MRELGELWHEIGVAPEVRQRAVGSPPQWAPRSAREDPGQLGSRRASSHRRSWGEVCWPAGKLPRHESLWFASPDAWPLHRAKVAREGRGRRDPPRMLRSMS
eukprot:scaffold154891_cov21-Tisochrysis_lutea.AAC.1